MTYTWLAVEMRTGRVITDMPGFDCDRVGARLCDHYATTGTLTIPTAATKPYSMPAPQNDDPEWGGVVVTDLLTVGEVEATTVGSPDAQEWRRALLPYGSVLVLLDDGAPIWGGIVTAAPRTEADTVTVSLASWESYFSRRYVPGLSYAAQEQCFILANLVTSTLDGTVPLIVEYTAGTIPRTIEWAGADDKKLGAAMQELSSLMGGPEWTVTWRRLSTPERYVPVLTIADRIGTSPIAGMAPAATFEMPGPVASFSFNEDWADGGGANSIVATSTSDGGLRPQSTPAVYADPERPTVEYRYSPSQNLAPADLDTHAAAALAVMRDGSASVSLTAIKADAPKLGVDWHLGDDVGYRIQHPSVGLLEGTARCLGWEATVGGVETVTPILASEGN